MAHILLGFKETISKIKGKSAFDTILASKQKWCFYLVDGKIITGILEKVEPYEVFINTDDGLLELKKLVIEFVFPMALREKITPLISVDEEIAEQKIEPTEDRKIRHHIKNRTLYPLIIEHDNITVTFYSGKKLTGQLVSFTTYEILLTLGPKLPVVILRHAVFSAFSSNGMNMLKEVQQQEKMWQKSRLWVEEPKTKKSTVK